MATSSQELIEGLAAHVKLEGSDYDQWYIGVTTDSNAKLFDEHGVVQDVNWYFVGEATSVAEATAACDHFRREKMDGGQNEAGTSLYAFRKRPNTKPPGPEKPPQVGVPV